MNDKLPDHYVFPAVLEDSDGKVFVYFPDIPGCTSCGDNDFNTIQSSKEALVIALEHLKSIGEDIPTPSKPSDIKTESPNDRIVYVSL